jgi:type II restriction/modification system DNA methylase subunit YeeA
VTPADFAAKWDANTRTERAAAQEHFIDLCQMLDVPTPNSDPHGADYAFEKGAEKTGGRDGWADVWQRRHFAWEYKKKHRDLAAAYDQLLKYREALDNPPLLVVSDMARFEIHTNFTNTPSRVYVFTLADLAERPAEPLRWLRALFDDPDSLRPDVVRATVTVQAADKFARLAQTMRDPEREPVIEGPAVAHFLDRVLFCLYAEDAGLLPRGLMKQLADNLYDNPAGFNSGLARLFEVMAREGGTFGTAWIDWFDGGLFDEAPSIDLRRDEIRVIRDAADLDWADVEPAIFGTLFERGLDPDKRSQLGAHYTDRASIERLVDAAVMVPLRRDLAETRAAVDALLVGDGATDPAAVEQARGLARALLERLRAVTVLDPACGSGNFLYLALRLLKDLEHEVIDWSAERVGMPREETRIGPRSLRGIEVNPYAAELARVVIWIGEIQWLRDHGHPMPHNPILPPLDVIETRDAILDVSDPTHPVEPDWPDATFIVGNPPFLGGKLLRSYLGDAYVEALFTVYAGRVRAEADLVTYWFEKARANIAAGGVRRAGLLATQGIRGGASRRVLDRICESGAIFMARSDDPWILDGAAVHVSFVAFDDGTERERTLDGLPVAAINANLTGDIDLTRARPLRENLGIAFMGDTKGGPFDVPDDVARPWLRRPNPDGRDNRDVVRPWMNGLDLTRRPRDMWIVDFGTHMTREEAALYEAPFEYVRRRVEPTRSRNRRAAYAERWWLHVEPRSGMRAALADLGRFIATARVARHRLFVWVPAGTLVDSATIAFARDDDCTFGILQSRVHTTWARRMGTQLREAESGSRYTPTTCFETFPFPRPTDQHRAAIAEAAANLDRLRQGWLNPSDRPYDLTDRELTRRTLTNLYNQNPTWLQDAHARLDVAVLDAYGWPYDIGDEELLARLLDLNLSRASQAGMASA